MKKGIWVFIQNSNPLTRTLEDALFLELADSQLSICTVQENTSDKLTAFLARRKVVKLTCGMFTGFLAGRYQLGRTLERLAKQYEHVNVLFLNTTFRYPAGVLKAYKEQSPNIRYVLFYFDNLRNAAANYANYLREHAIFDVVYTFDEWEAKNNGFVFWRTPYSARPELLGRIPRKDMYFSGRSSGRYAILHTLSQAGIGHDAKLEMDVCLTPPDNVNDFSQSSPTFRLHSRGELMTYETVLEKTLEARCILDVVCRPDAGLSLRAYEAVVYNRKLLTNNPSILTFPFYDPRYMHYFQSAEDIDWDWVKEDTAVDYHYNGEFSPVNLLKDAEKRLWGACGNRDMEH